MTANGSTPRGPVQTLLVWLALPAALTIGGFLLLGIPGALLMEMGAPLAGVFTKQRLPGDSAWPMAIVVSLVWPCFLLPARWAASQLMPSQTPWWRGVGMLALAFAVAAGALLAAGLQVAAGRL